MNGKTLKMMKKPVYQSNMSLFAVRAKKTGGTVLYTKNILYIIGVA